MAACVPPTATLLVIAKFPPTICTFPVPTGPISTVGEKTEPSDATKSWPLLPATKPPPMVSVPVVAQSAP